VPKQGTQRNQIVTRRQARWIGLLLALALLGACGTVEGELPPSQTSIAPTAIVPTATTAVTPSDRPAAAAPTDVPVAHPATATPDTATDSTRVRDAGGGWARLGPWIGGVAAIAVSPTYPADHTLFASAASAGVYRSTDGGASWWPAWTGLARMDAAALAISPAYAADRTLFLGGRFGGAYRSTDGGESWQPIEDLQRASVPVQAIVVSPDYARDRAVFAALGDEPPSSGGV